MPDACICSAGQLKWGQNIWEMGLCCHRATKCGFSLKHVGLSNICYTMLNKFLQDSLWGFPAQRSHRKQVIVPAVIDLELPGKVLKGIKSMRSIKPFIIFAMAALHFSIMPGRKWADQFMADAMLF